METTLQITLFIAFVIGIFKPSLYLRFDVPIPKRLALLIIYLVLACIVDSFIAPKPELTPEQRREIVERNERIGRQKQIEDSIKDINSKCKVAVIMCLKRSLNDPDSYEDVSWSNVEETELGYTITHKFRAKNGFGGKITEQKTFYLTKQFIVTNIK